MFNHRFSRKMIWLKVAPSNSDPKVIARYYLETVEEIAGIQVDSTISHFNHINGSFLTI